MTLDFTVFGVAAPQGSMKSVTPKNSPRAVLVSDNTHTRPWRQQISWTALLEKNRQGFELVKRPGGVRVRLAFFFDRPRSVKYLDKTTKPDMDKLQRAVFDALTGVVYEDDAQVVAVSCTKAFGSPARMDARIETIVHATDASRFAREVTA